MIGVTDPFAFCFAVEGAIGGTSGILVADPFPFCFVDVGFTVGLLLNLPFVGTDFWFPATLAARPLEESCMEPSISMPSASDPDPDLRHLPFVPPQDCSVIEDRCK